MTFPVHRSSEPTAGERGEAFGRAQAGPVRRTLELYERMFAEHRLARPGPDRASRARV